MLDQTHRDMLQAVAQMGNRCHGHAAPALQLAKTTGQHVDPEDARVLLNQLAADGYLKKEVSAAGVPQWKLTVKGLNEA